MKYVAIVNRFMSDVEVKHIAKFESGLIDFLTLNYPEIGKEIINTGVMSAEAEENLKKAIQEFKASFVAE